MNALLSLAAVIVWSGWFAPSTAVVVVVVIGIALFLKYMGPIDNTLRRCLIFIGVALTVVWGILLFLFVLDRLFGVTL